MPRARMIKPGFWSDEKLCLSCTRETRLLYIGMWNFSDDYGVIKGHPTWLRNQIFPYDDISSKTFTKWLEDLMNGGFIIPFASNGENYFFIKNFLKHQNVNRPSDIRNPQPPESLTEGSVSTHQIFSEDSVNTHGGLMAKKKLNKIKIKNTCPPPPGPPPPSLPPSTTYPTRALDTHRKKKDNVKTLSSSNDDGVSLFNKFWSQWPKSRKMNKRGALMEWNKLPMDDALELKIFTALEKQKTWEEWTRDNGKYIPHAARWLKYWRWEDENEGGTINSQAKISMQISDCDRCGKRHAGGHNNCNMLDVIKKAEIEDENQNSTG